MCFIVNILCAFNLKWDELFLFHKHAEIQGPSTEGEYSLLIVLFSYGIIHQRHLALLLQCLGL